MDFSLKIEDAMIVLRDAKFAMMLYLVTDAIENGSKKKDNVLKVVVVAGYLTKTEYANNV